VKEGSFLPTGGGYPINGTSRQEKKMPGRSVPVHDRDYIAIMPEDEIRAKVNQYRGWIESDRRRGQETHDIEVEYCYLAEELKLRETRRRNHEDFMRRNPQVFDEYYYDNEAN
jgi:hypothetical protein